MTAGTDLERPRCTAVPVLITHALSEQIHRRRIQAGFLHRLHHPHPSIPHDRRNRSACPQCPCFHLCPVQYLVQVHRRRLFRIWFRFLHPCPDLSMLCSTLRTDRHKPVPSNPARVPGRYRCPQQEAPVDSTAARSVSQPESPTAAAALHLAMATAFHHHHCLRRLRVAASVQNLRHCESESRLVRSHCVQCRDCHRSEEHTSELQSHSFISYA